MLYFKHREGKRVSLGLLRKGKRSRKARLTMLVLHRGKYKKKNNLRRNELLSIALIYERKANYRGI